MSTDRLYQHLSPDKQGVDELVESPLGWFSLVPRLQARAPAASPPFLWGALVPSPVPIWRERTRTRERVGPGLSHRDARHGSYSSTPATYESVVSHLTVRRAAFHRTVFLASRCSPPLSWKGKEKASATTARQLTDRLRIIAERSTPTRCRARFKRLHCLYHASDKVSFCDPTTQQRRRPRGRRSLARSWKALDYLAHRRLSHPEGTTWTCQQTACTSITARQFCSIDCEDTSISKSGTITPAVAIHLSLYYHTSLVNQRLTIHTSREQEHPQHRLPSF
jgi:hypothetical protein